MPQASIDKWLSAASELFGKTFQFVRAVQEQSASLSWASDIYSLEEPGRTDKLIYKSRRLFPIEALEIEDVLHKIQANSISHFCPIVDYKVRDSVLHLLLKEVEGRPFDHFHDDAWNNEPSFTNFLAGLSWTLRIKISQQLLAALAELHSHELLFQDLKIEQLLLTPEDDLVILDLDTIVLRNGLCAKRTLWTSILSPRIGDSCSQLNDIYQAACVVVELFTGRHFAQQGGNPIAAIGQLIRARERQFHGPPSEDELIALREVANNFADYWVRVNGYPLAVAANLPRV